MAWMPLNKIRLQNFKCFEDSGDIALAPLTLIFGRNNTGKSTILQSLLLLRQTLDSPSGEPRLHLGGTLYPAGTYADIVRNHRSKTRVVITLGVDQAAGSRAPGSGNVEMEFQSDEPRPPRLVRLAVGRDTEKWVEITKGRGRGGPYELKVGTRKVGVEKKANFTFRVDAFFPLIGPEPRHRGRPNRTHVEYRRLGENMLRETERIIQGLRAVGAFRRQPQRRYEFQGGAPDQIDAAGERVIDAVIEDALRRRGPGELFKSLNSWLRRVGKVQLLPLKRMTRSGRMYEVRVKDVASGKWAHFADVGFGIGQALPVLVEGLRTDEGGTLVVQEPEIHLHPDAQLAMADFLIDLACSGRRVIAETHSENVLLRVRQRLLSPRRNGRISRLEPSAVSLIYVDKDHSGTSHAQRLELDDLGQIKNWPTGFMEEATEERMVLMDGMARGAKRRGR